MTESVAAGTVLIAEGDGADATVFVIDEGRFDVVVANGGAPLVVGERGPGDVVGELVGSNGGVRTATVRAATDGVVQRFTPLAFDAWLDERPDAADELMTASVARLDEIRLARFLGDVIESNVSDGEETDVVRDIVSRASWRRLGGGEQLFAQGDEADAAYVVLTGRLSITADDAEGNRSVDLEIGRGDVVGELGLIDKSPRAATVRALRATTLAELSLETFQDLMTRHPEVMLHVFRRLLVRTARPTARAQATRTVTVIDVADGLLDAEQVVAEIGRHGSVTSIGARDLDAELRTEGAACASDASVLARRVDRLLHERELGFDVVVFRVGADDGPEWRDRAVRQSDRVLVVCSPRPDADERRRIEDVRALVDRLEHVTRWTVVVHAADAEAPRSADHPGRDADELHHLRADRPGDVRRLARLATGNGTAVVLSGGGARGYAHLGALRALEEQGIEIDRIGGASMGSVIAGLAAADPADEIAAVRRLGELMADLLDYTVPLVALTSGRKVWKAIVEFFGDQMIEDLWIPYFCVSTNLTTAQVVIHRSGRLGVAVRASTAIPGVFPPVPVDGDLLADGGILDNLPVDVMAADASIRRIIAVEVTPPTGPRAKADFGPSVSGWRALGNRLFRRGPAVPAISGVLLRSLLVGSSRDRARFLDAGMVDLLIQLDLRGVGLLDFGTVDPVVERGYEGAVPVIEEWRSSSETGPSTALS